jgi:TM2 domain-containing membrane protein YozV
MQYPPGGPHNPYGPPGYGPPPAPPGYPPAPPGYPPPGFPPYGAPGAFGMPNPAAPFGVHPTLGVPYSDKSKIAAGLLQLFVGFGAGRFYTGHTNTAVTQLVVCLLGIFVLSWFTCGASVAVVFWTFIDGIILLAQDSTDAQGRILR